MMPRTNARTMGGTGGGRRAGAGPDKGRRKAGQVRPAVGGLAAFQCARVPDILIRSTPCVSGRQSSVRSGSRGSVRHRLAGQALPGSAGWARRSEEARSEEPATSAADERGDVRRSRGQSITLTGDVGGRQGNVFPCRGTTRSPRPSVSTEQKRTARLRPYQHYRHWFGIDHGLLPDIGAVSAAKGCGR